MCIVRISYFFIKKLVKNYFFVCFFTVYNILGMSRDNMCFIFIQIRDGGQYLGAPLLFKEESKYQVPTPHTPPQPLDQRCREEVLILIPLVPSPPQANQAACLI